MLCEIACAALKLGIIHLKKPTPPELHALVQGSNVFCDAICILARSRMISGLSEVCILLKETVR